MYGKYYMTSGEQKTAIASSELIIFLQCDNFRQHKLYFST